MSVIKIVIMIPAYNEEETISQVVLGAKEHADVIVVDDGSTDRTAELAKKGAIVFINVKNIGYEKTIEAGLAKARALGYTHAITMDADGQHYPSSLLSFINEINCGFDLVLGVRNKLQRPAEKLFSAIGNLIWKIKDPLCGMKAYKLSLLNTYGPFAIRSSAGAEFAIRLVRNKILFSEVSVPTRPRVDESRYGDGFTVNAKIILTMLSLLINNSEK